MAIAGYVSVCVHAIPCEPEEKNTAVIRFRVKFAGMFCLGKFLGRGTNRGFQNWVVGVPHLLLSLCQQPFMEFIVSNSISIRNASERHSCIFCFLSLLIQFNYSYVCNNLGNNFTVYQSGSYVTSDSQSVSLSWCQAPI
jgi:hypothetical protein